MNFDIVHDIQQIYRKVVQCYSNPGRVMSIKENCYHMDYDSNINKGILSLALMVLDREVTYTVASKDKEEHSRFLTQLTYGVSCKIKGDYLFILNDSNITDALELVENSSIGTLIDPHKSSTLIFEVNSLEKGIKLKLTGPGIECKNYSFIDINEELLEVRNNKNIEFPRGIDCIFVDKEYNVLAIPRTTKIEKMEA